MKNTEIEHEYTIVITRSFYGPKSERHILTDYLGLPLTFTSRKEAQDKIEELDNEVVHLRHGESDRPELKARKISTLGKQLKEELNNC